MKNPKPKPLTESQWFELFKLIPGYDCLRDADGYHFDCAAAQHVIDFFQTRLRHIKGPKAGQPIILENWQKAVLGCIFGWKNKDGSRRYREVFLYIPRKNGKTILIAGIAVMMLVCGSEGGQEIYSAAAEKEQAKIAHSMAKGMVEKDPDINSRVTIYKDYIETNTGNHIYRALSAEAYSKHGFNASCILIDELHAHPNGDLVEVLVSSTGARAQPLTFYATTADYDRPSVCNEKLTYAKSVRDGEFSAPEFLPVLFMAETSDDWESEETWRKANPNLGVSVPIEFFRAEYMKAKRILTHQNTFRRLYLNQQTQQVNRWIDLGDWDKCSGLKDGETPLEWRYRILGEAAGLPCHAGLDLGAVSDLTALTLLFDGESLGYPDSVVVVPFAWCPGDSIDAKTEKNQALYWSFSEQGLMDTTPGNVADYRYIRMAINDLGEQYRIQSIMADRLFQGAQLCIELADDGFDVVEFGQGFLSMAAPSKEFEERVKAGRIIHGGNPLLRWQAGNVNVKEDPSGNMKPVKPSKNSEQKIDNIVCAIMALAKYNETPLNSTTQELIFI